jgi:endonuclease/exonuclease/phosphatase family metal-dependent hydrolase
LLNVLVGANIMTIILMLVSGYSDHLSPADYQTLACAGMLFPFTLLTNVLFVAVWALLSWKRLLVPIAGLLLAYPAIRVYVPLHGKASVPEDALCVVSYNVCTFGGNYKYEHAFDTIFNYLKAQKADIVCLQEDAPPSLKACQAYFPYNDTVQLNAVATAGYNYAGIHTRFPILKRERLNYYSRTNGSTAYYLDVDGDTVIVVNNHLESSHLDSSDRNTYEEMIKGTMARDTATAETKLLLGKLSEAMAIRSAQADSVHAFVERHKARYPIIVCGDFNDTPISYTRRKMAEGLTDCYVETGRGLGISFNRRGFYFRIDHMMCSEHFRPCASKIDSEMDVSDHYPLVCWLEKAEKP